MDFGPLASAGTLQSDTIYYLRVVPAAPTGRAPGGPRTRDADLPTAVDGDSWLPTSWLHHPSEASSSAGPHQYANHRLPAPDRAECNAAVGFGGHIAAGQEVCYSPPTGGDDSFWGQLTSVVNTIIANILAEIIPGCDDTRRGVLLTVEKAALTAVGLPPSLPDTSRLQRQGVLLHRAGRRTMTSRFPTPRRSASTTHRAR